MPRIVPMEPSNAGPEARAELDRQLAASELESLRDACEALGSA